MGEDNGNRNSWFLDHELTPEEKGAMDEVLSDMLNLKDSEGKPAIMRVRKITGDKPTWRIDLVDSRSISIRNAGGILYRDQMNAIIFAATNRQIKPYSRKEWREVVAAFTAAIVEEPAGLESYAAGELHVLLEQYLTATGVKLSAGEAFGDPRLLFMPFEANGRITVNATDFREWIVKHKNNNMEIADMANRLSAIGAECREFQPGAGRQKQSRWILPACFEPATWRRLAAEAARAGYGRMDDDEPEAKGAVQ
jgi:hypothetical protein